MTTITQKKSLGHSVNFTNLRFTVPTDKFVSSLQVILPRPINAPPAWNNVVYVIVEMFHDKSDILTTTAGLLSGNSETLVRGWVRESSGEGGQSPDTLIIDKLTDSVNLSTIQVRVYNLSNTTAEVIPAIFKLHYYDRIFVQNNNYDLEENRGVYAFDKKAIQNAVGGGTFIVTVQPQAGSHFEIESILLQPAFTGAEEVILLIADENLGTTKSLIYEATVTNTVLEGPGSHVLADDTESSTSAITGGLGTTYPKMKVQYPDQLYFIVSSIPQNDTLIIRMRLRLKDVVPTVTLSGTGTEAWVDIATYTTQYDKVI